MPLRQTSERLTCSSLRLKKQKWNEKLKKVEQGILVAMISLISASIIIMVLSSYMELLNESLISSLAFSVGLVLLIIRVWTAILV